MDVPFVVMYWQILFSTCRLFCCEFFSYVGAGPRVCPLTTMTYDTGRHGGLPLHIFSDQVPAILLVILAA